MKYNILTFILAFLLSGCSVTEDYKDHCPGQGEDEAGLVTLSFKLISSSIATTRADDSHEEIASEWPAFEDLIQADDFAFFIFCEQEDKTWPLVLKMTDIKNSTDPNMMITGAPGTYTVTAKIRKEELGHDITPGSADLVNFRMVVLANAGADNKYDDLDTTSFEKFIEAASKWKININTIYQASSSSEGTDESFKGGIPMFGLKEFKFSKGALYSSRPEERLWVGEIYMLRAVSKIRVVDNITTRDANTGLPRIESVTFQGRTLEAYALPGDAARYKNEQQVETPNPVSGGETGPIRLDYLTSDNKTVFGYIPEQYISNDLPKLNITLTFELDEAGKPSNTETFEIPMSGYNDQTLNFGGAILRNHIYTLGIDLDKNHNLLCTVTVFPYTAVRLNPLFGFSVSVKEVHIKTADSPKEVLDVEKVTLAEGQTVSLVGYVSPEDANNKGIVWSSNRIEIATVDTNDGLVTGVSKGTAIITATSVDNPNISASCEVTVSPKIPVTDVSLKLPSTWTGNMNIGETANLVASIDPWNATDQSIDWISSDSNIASVSPYGTVTAVNPGEVTITAKSKDNPTKSATCTVTVNERVMVNSVNMSQGPTGTFYEGAQFSFTATVTPNTATNQSLKWTSSNNNVATVSSYGLVTAIEAGTATIKAEATDGSGKSATRTVTVTAKSAVTGITISSSTATTTVGADPKLQLTATITPTNPTYKTLRWTSSNPYVAVVSGGTSPNAGKATATVTATNKGKTTITVTSVDNPDISASCEVTVD